MIFLVDDYISTLPVGKVQSDALLDSSALLENSVAWLMFQIYIWPSEAAAKVKHVK